jgi:hypothetical protein
MARTDGVVFPPAPREQVGAGSGPGDPGAGPGGVSGGDPPAFVTAGRTGTAEPRGAAVLVTVTVTWVGRGVVSPLETVVVT